MHRFIAPMLVSLASAAVHTVQVGQGGLTFSPQTISAVQGDTVVFELFAGHNVVEGEFDSPCETDDDDFYSGPFSDTDNGARKFVVNVTSNDPVYYFCSVQRHCQNGMVGGINIPTSGETIEAYSQAAANVQQAETPSSIRGGQLLDDSQIASLTGGEASASASASGSSASSAASAGTTSTPTGSGSASPSASAASASSTAGAAIVASGQVSGVAAMIIGVAAWLI